MPKNCLKIVLLVPCMLVLLVGGLVPQKTVEATTLLARDASIQPDAAIIQLLQPIIEEHKLPGMVGAIIQGDQLLAIGAVGVRKQGQPNPITIHDQMHLGSCTKAMTATLIGQLVQQKKLQWTTTLVELFPEHAEKIHPDYRTVTMTQLLTHRAGLPANTTWWQLGAELSTMQQRENLLKKVLYEAPTSPPGSKFEYSNVGYALAGLAAEKLTGKSWELLMQERLFQPLGMKSAGFGPPGTKGKLDQPWGHLLSKEKATPLQRDNAPALGPAGTVHASLIDWAKFGSLHLGKGALDAMHLTPEILEQLHTPPQGEKYAMGWSVANRSWAKGQAITHAGSNTMWYAVIWLAPKRNFGVLVATNAAGETAPKACNDASSALIKHFEKLVERK